MSDNAYAAEFAAQVDHDFRAATPASAAIAVDHANKVCPGGDYRTMVWFAPYPIVMEKAEGCYLHDVDGNQYLDFASNWSSMVLGNAPTAVVEAVRASLDQGLAMSAPTESAYRWAEMICERIKSVERVRFSCSGTEAAMFALRTARAFTGKDKFIKIEGGFHGSYDPIHYHVGWGPWEKGMPRSVMQDVVTIPANDIEAAKEIILANKDEAGCVIMEPMMGAAGFVLLDEDYIRFIRDITEELGMLLIFDEVVTFRLAPGGMQEILGIDADITILGKALASGTANGAFGGRADVMELYNQATQESPMFHSGTFIATPAVAAAGIASLESLTRDAIDRINGMGETLADRIRSVLEDLGIKAIVAGVGSLQQLHWRTAPLRNADDGEAQAASLKPVFCKLMLKRGFFVSNRNIFVISTPMGQAEMDATVQAVAETLGEMRPLIEAVAPELLAD